MRVLGVIPARGGSKSIPHKNLAMLCGKRLIQWTISAAIESRLTSFVVSTDDDDTIHLCTALGVHWIWRPSELCRDGAPTIPVLQHAVRYLVEEMRWEADAIACLQPTNPLRETSDINGAIDLMERTNCDSVISFTPCSDAHPARMCQLDGDKVPPQDFTRRQDLPPYYLRDGSIYLVKRDVLMAGSMTGSDCRAWIIPRERHCNIDSIEDLDVAEVRMRRLRCESS